jgi:hypothetical protein
MYDSTLEPPPWVVHAQNLVVESSLVRVPNVWGLSVVTVHDAGAQQMYIPLSVCLLLSNASESSQSHYKQYVQHRTKTADDYPPSYA